MIHHGNKVKPVTGKGHGDIEVNDYVVLPRHSGPDNRFPPHPLILYVTMTLR